MKPVRSIFYGFVLLLCLSASSQPANSLEPMPDCVNGYEYAPNDMGVLLMRTLAKISKMALLLKHAAEKDIMCTQLFDPLFIDADVMNFINVASATVGKLLMAKGINPTSKTVIMNGKIYALFPDNNDLNLPLLPVLPEPEASWLNTWRALQRYATAIMEIRNACAKDDKERSKTYESLYSCFLNILNFGIHAGVQSGVMKKCATVPAVGMQPAAQADPGEQMLSQAKEVKCDDDLSCKSSSESSQESSGYVSSDSHEPLDESSSSESAGSRSSESL